MTFLILALTLIAGDRKVPQCYANLCGLEMYCSCHTEGGKQRCWTTQTDCEVDALCCAEGGGCGAKAPDGRDACFNQTAKERKERDKAK